LDAKSPLEVWASVTGLVIQWSQFNEWLLLIISLSFALLAAFLFVRWRRTTATELSERVGHQPFLRRVERYLVTVKGVAAVGGLATLVFAAWIYQQYLWHVALPVPQGAIGVAISRQAFSSVSIDAISSELAGLGHGEAVVVRELPVGYGANDVDRGRDLARKIGASAFVIIREDNSSAASLASSPTPGTGEDVLTPDRNLTAVIAFVDPSFGLELPLAIRTPQGPSTAFRAKQGIEVPQLQARDLGRLLEAAAGLILYDQDRLTGSVEHLRQALPPPGVHEAMEPIVRFHIASAAYLLGDDSTATAELRRVLELLQGAPLAGIQDRLVFIAASNMLAHLLAIGDQRDEARTLAQRAVGEGDALLRDESALADEGTYVRVHQAVAESFIVLAELSSGDGDNDATELWLSRAAEEGRSLASRQSDRRSVLAGARALYLSGKCPDAYAQMLELLRADPNDREALQMLIRIASLRDLEIGSSLEGEADLDRLLQIGTPRLIDLRFEYIRESLDAVLVDRDSAALLDPIAESMLQADPTNELTLEAYVDDRRLSLGWWIDFPPWLLPPRNGAHVPTFVREQAAMVRDAAELLAVADDADTVRLAALRWAVELDPGPEAWLAVSAVDERAFGVLDRYVPTHNASADDSITQRMTDATDALFGDTDRIIALPDSSQRQQAQARLMRGLNALNRYFYIFGKTNDGQVAGWPDSITLLDAAIAELESARTGIEAEPDDQDGNLVDWQVFGYLSNAYLARSGEAHIAGDDVEATRLRALASDNAQKQQAVEPTTPEAFQTPLGQCAGADEKTGANQALAQGDAAGAISHLEKYLGDYPNDPAALVALARAYAANGDPDGSMQLAQSATLVAPQQPDVQLAAVAPLLVGQRVVQATAVLETGLAGLAAEPPSTGFDFVEALARDLHLAAEKHPAARAEIAALVAKAADWLGAADLPAHAVPAYVEAADALAMASLWADDPAGANALLEQAAERSQSALVAAHRGLVALTNGNETEFTTAVDAAIAAASSYADLQCPSGQSCTAVAEEWAPYAAQWQSRDLRQAAADYREFALHTPELTAALEGAAARFEAAAQ
jgi:hypothetical protein